ncbi:hypothetical protein OIU84_004749 [Salix udensis]|uniref:Epidermal patterning factor-like protein n=1 Tax=Salix udensis TaxID=889485 RepID=A0AAD6K370_9ROSI|nr:hypothetical protein OIU84_004749 [Salix udensis]
MQRCFQFNGGNKMPRNLLFIECSYLKGARKSGSRPEEMKRALQSRLSSDFLLYTRDFWGVSQIFQKPELLFCAEGPAQRTRSPSCTGLTKYRCKIRDSIHQEKPEKSWSAGTANGELGFLQQAGLLRPITVLVFIKQDKAFNLYRLFWTRTLTPNSVPEKKDIEIKEGMMNEAAAAADYAKGIAKIGSTPPSCEHKCHGCSPCEPIQVPTITKTDNHHFKCKLRKLRA